VRRLLFAMGLLLCASAANASIANIYYAQTAAGLADGTSCANAYAVHDAVNGFNAAGKWGAGGTQIGQDTVVHLCGTYTGAANEQDVLFPQGSGASGHPITVKAETGFILTSPVWGAFTGSPITNHQNFIVFDGANTGIIRNTANGTGLAFNQNSNFFFNDGHDVTIKNWTLTNLCVHLASPNDETSCSSSGVQPYAIQTSGSNNLVTGNTISNTFAGVFFSEGASDTGVVISNNTISNMNWGIGIGLTTGANSGTLDVFGNDISTAANWDETLNNNHHNCIFYFQGNGGTQSGATNIYNNYCHGDFGIHQTSLLFIDPNGGTIANVRIFNNLLVNPSTVNGAGNGYITGCGTNTVPFGQIYNNTIVGSGAGLAGIKTDSPCKILNNIITGMKMGISVNPGTTLTSSNNNVFFGLTGNGGAVMGYGATSYATVAAWISGTGFDTASSVLNPNLNSASVPPYQPQAGSSAILLGTNLTALGITPLNSDFLGVSRPAPATNWTSGAFQFGGATAPVLSFSPSPAAFGNQNIGTTGSLSITVSNVGTATETYSSFSLSPSVFTNGNTGLGGQCPASGTIGVSASCTVLAKFTPAVVTNYSGTLSFVGTVNGSDVLTGSGTNAISIPSVPTGLTTAVSGSTVNLSWTASTGTPANYVLRRATVSGGPYTTIASPTVTSYADTGLAAGTYFYVVAAQNSAGTSANSTQANATIIALVPAVNIIPASLNFGLVNQGSTATQGLTVTNSGTGTLNLTGSAVTISGANAADFTVDGTTTCTNGLARTPGQQCNIVIDFLPTTTTFEQATVCLNSNSPDTPDCATMTGTGVGPVLVSPTSLNFGNINKNKSSTAQIVTYSNNSGSTVTLSISITGTNASEFSKTTTCGGTQPNGTPCTVSVTFSPTSNGSKSANLVFTDTASGSPRTVTLSGQATGKKVLRVGAVVGYKKKQTNCCIKRTLI